MKLLLLLSFVALAACIKHKSNVNKHEELFKYSQTDEYTLPEDIDDDKPPVIFSGDDKTAKIINLENKNHGQGKFKYNLKTQNGIELTQVGKLKDEDTFVVSGSYSYTGSDGKRYRVRYTADELGYHPITELDVDIPEIETNNNQNQNFQFLSHDLDNNRFNNGNNNNNNGNNNNGHDSGDGQIGDDYSYTPPGQDLGSKYLPPKETDIPNRLYLPSL